MNHLYDLNKIFKDLLDFATNTHLETFYNDIKNFRSNDLVYKNWISLSHFL